MATFLSETAFEHFEISKPNKKEELKKYKNEYDKDIRIYIEKFHKTLPLFKKSLLAASIARIRLNK